MFAILNLFTLKRKSLLKNIARDWAIFTKKGFYMLLSEKLLDCYVQNIIKNHPETSILEVEERSYKAIEIINKINLKEDCEEQFLQHIMLMT